MATLKKRVVSGSIAPRWPKARVLRWLEWGSIPAILGLWLPDWVGGYATAWGGAKLSPLAVPFPPVLTYSGAVILFVGCLEGIRDMGAHYRVARILAVLAVLSAVASLPLHFLADGPGPAFAAELLSIGLAAALGTGVLGLTIAKVAEIATETRARRTRDAVAVLGVVATAAGVASAVLVVIGNSAWPLALRACVVLFTGAFLACRYGVYCYRAQTSIGAAFAAAPDEQFWV